MAHLTGTAGSVDKTEPAQWGGAYKRLDKNSVVLDEPWVRPNLSAPSIQVGHWYRAELFLKASSKVGVADGEYHVFMTTDQGITTKVTEHANLDTGADPMNY